MIQVSGSGLRLPPCYSKTAGPKLSCRGSSGLLRFFEMKDIYSTREKYLYYFCWLMEHIFGPRKGQGMFGRKKDSLALRFQERLLKRPPAKTVPIETFDQLSEEEFLNKYVLTGRSVLIKGAAKNWPAVGKWSHHWFAENYPNETQPFVDPETKGYGYKELSFKEIAAEIDKGSQSYVKFSNFLHKTPGAENDFDMSLIEKYKLVKNVPSAKQLFMGAAGTRSGIHAALANVFFVQIFGHKRWLLIPEEWTPILNPQVDRQPHFLVQEELLFPDNPDKAELFKRFEFVEVNMEPGDFYFNPAFCWHYVDNKTPSIGIGFRWIPVRAAFRSPILTSFILLSQYPFSIIRAFGNPRGVFFPKRWP